MAANARALLRASRESRRIDHPHASYAGGKLSCMLCRTAIKAEVQWDSHIRSQQHMERVKAMHRPEAGLPSRKRKARDAEEDGTDDSSAVVQDQSKRKRVTFDLGDDEAAADESNESQSTGEKENAAEQGQDEATETTQDEVNADEWDAFEKDMQRLESVAAPDLAKAQSQGTSGVVISAAPVSAEELAARAREEQSLQRSQKEDELEAEGEDAVARLDEEAEEMTRLQLKMRQLRDRREALQKLALNSENEEHAGDSSQSKQAASDAAAGGSESLGDTDDDDDDDDDDDEGDEWNGFRR